MGLSAAQQHLPLSTGPRPVAPVFAAAVEPVSADPARPVDPDIGDRIAGVQVDLHEEFARLKANKWRAVNVAASAEYAGGDTAEIALEALSTYLQNGNATMRLIGLAIEAGTISSDIYTDRFAA